MLVLLLMPEVVAQNLTVRVNRLNTLKFSNLTNTGVVSQPVTDPDVAVFRVRVRRHNTLQRTLDVDISVPSIPEVQNWNIAYTVNTDDPASSTPTTLPRTWTVNSAQAAGANRVDIYFYVYVDVNFGPTSAAYDDSITLTATLSET